MKKCLLFMLAAPFASCEPLKYPVSTEPAHNNQQYTVDYLFEHDGCRIYRFYDNGNYVYFTNCRGETIVQADSSTVIRNTTTIKKE